MRRRAHPTTATTAWSRTGSPRAPDGGARCDGRRPDGGHLRTSCAPTTFSYLVTNWLMGETPPAFDILAWNADSTRLPAAMHSAYLRSLYLRNELARGELTMDGQRLALSDIVSDAYVVAAVNDHIVPWVASYQATRLLGGDVTYV